MTEFIVAAETAVANNKEVKSALQKFNYLLILELAFISLVTIYIVVQLFMTFKQSRCCGLCGKRKDYDDDVPNGRSLEMEYTLKKFLRGKLGVTDPTMRALG